MSEQTSMLNEMTSGNNKTRENCSLDLNVLHINSETEIGWTEVIKNLIIKPDLDTNYRLITTYEDAKKYFIACDYILYDVVIMDINLKQESEDIQLDNKSGYHLLIDIRKKDLMIPVVILTSSNYELNKPKLDKFGIIEYILKPSIEQEPSSYQIDKLKAAINKCALNGWHHYVRRILLETYNKTNPEIKSKFMAIMYKLYSAAYLTSDFSNQYLEDNHFLHNNESILYLHSIMTDVLRKKWQSGPCIKKQLNGTLVGLNNADISNINFGKEYIIKENFQTDSRIRLLNYLNYLRNHAKPMHGNSRIKITELLICMITVTYEVNDAFSLKQNKFGMIPELDSFIKTTIQVIHKKESGNPDAVKDEKSRLLDICNLLDCNYNKMSSQV